MGQRNSSARYCNGQDGVQRAITPSGSIRRSLRKKIGPKHVSTTFNLIHSSLDTSPLDVNLATVDDLSRLPGITPTLAARIVQHRETLGWFSQTEDVALVNGVGAERLHRIRPYICLGGHDIRYYGNSSPPSPDSISSCHQGLHKINLNTATIFDLLQVQCLSQELADNIIHYRVKHGDFRSLSQLSRVRGISRRTAKALVHFLTLDDTSEVDSGSERTSVTAPVVLPSRHVGGPWGHRRTQSGPVTLHEPYIPSFVDVCELLAVHTPRPSSDRRLVSQRHGRPVVRLATWNLERLCADKIANPGVLEVICRTLLENDLAIVAVQDIVDDDALKKICNELNNPTLHRVNNWRGVRGCWHYAMSSLSTNQQSTDPAVSTNGQLGFLYDMSRSVRFEGSGLQAVCRHQGQPFVTSLVGRFKVNDSLVSVVTVRLRQASSDPPSGGESGNCWCALRPLDTVLRGALKQQQTIVVAGDFGLSSNQSEFDVLRDLKFHPILSGDVTTAAGESVTGSPPSGSPHPRHFSNIWIAKFSKLAYTGTYEVIGSGLSHLAIPNGWHWGGLVSSHAPVVCELYAKPAPDSSVSDRLATLQAEYQRQEELFRLEFEQMALASTSEFAVSPSEALVAVGGPTSAVVQRNMKTLCAA